MDFSAAADRVSVPFHLYILATASEVLQVEFKRTKSLSTKSNHAQILRATSSSLDYHVLGLTCMQSVRLRPMESSLLIFSPHWFTHGQTSRLQLPRVIDAALRQGARFFGTLNRALHISLLDCWDDRNKDQRSMHLIIPCSNFSASNMSSSTSLYPSHAIVVGSSVVDDEGAVYGYQKTEVN